MEIQLTYVHITETTCPIAHTVHDRRVLCLFR